MRKAQVAVYDIEMRKVAYLENAAVAGYEQPMNRLWKAQFTLPSDDKKNDECLPMRFVEIYDGDERIDLFRIMPTTARRSNEGKTITYECEHVLATLLDDVLFQFHTIGGLGVYTKDVLEYLLSKQTVKRWKLGTVSFSRQFEYNWENENLYNALKSVPGPFVEDYLWTWDTSTYPWTLNLVEPPQSVDAYIRYGLNLQGIERQIDPRNLCTRLYGLGYGEGVNQLNFAEINDGKPYIDADTQDQFGIISDIFVDRRFEHPETLKARCEAILNERKMPRITYQVDAADLSKLTDVPLHKFVSGGLVRVIDDDLGIDVIARVVNKRKPDLRGKPGEVELEISNKSVDIAGMFNELETRQRIHDLYAQGATNLSTHDFADNCDPEHPAIMRFYIPHEAARINKVLLSYRTEAFRAYSRAIAGGGAITTTTAAGGAFVSTTASGGASIESSETGDIEGPGPYTTGVQVGTVHTNDAGRHWHNLNITEDGKHWHHVVGNETDEDGAHIHPFSESDVVEDHFHIVEEHVHIQTLLPHTHKVHLPNHVHGINIPNHTHDINLPNHTHDIEHGIFNGPTPTAVTVEVDGIVVPGLGTDVESIDIVDYLEKDEDGRIRRGMWHEIKITPNNLGRIVANLVSQVFVQSRGGGDY